MVMSWGSFFVFCFVWKKEHEGVGEMKHGIIRIIRSKKYQ